MSALTPAIHSDPGILGSTPVCAGTRVPAQSLIDSLAAGDSLDKFLDASPPSRARRRLPHWTGPRGVVMVPVRGWSLTVLVMLAVVLVAQIPSL